MLIAIVSSLSLGVNVARFKLNDNGSSASEQSIGSSCPLSVGDADEMDNENSASNAGYKYTDNNEHRSSICVSQRRKKMPASLVDTEEGNEEAEIDDDGALPPKKKGRPGKSSLASLGKSTGSTASPLQGNRGN